MGFRAPYLRAAAEMIAQRKVDLSKLASCDLNEARQVLLHLPGVGRKIADCVLLFAFGFQEAFPVDVWIMRALRQLYFPGRRASRKRLEEVYRYAFWKLCRICPAIPFSLHANERKISIGDIFKKRKCRIP